MEFGVHSILALGIGGFIGAAAAALAAGFRLESSLRRFNDSFGAYIRPRSDAASLKVSGDFDVLKRDLSAMLKSVGNLRRALRIR